MDVYPSNSHASRKPVEKKVAPEPIVEEEPVKRVLTNKVTMRKKSLGVRFKETFLGGDAKSVFSYVTMEVVVPAIRETIVEMGTQALERMFYGDSRPSSRRSTSRSTGSGGYQNYSRYASPREDPRDRERDRERETRRRSKSDYQDIVIATRSEAQDVIDELYKKLKNYGTVSLMDLYEILEVTGEYTDERWGWKNLRGADIRRVHGGGYTLMLPELELLS